MPTKFLIALAGNPNVGKSTVFNALTGLNQHTGNWSGKTVDGAVGSFQHMGVEFVIEDIPGIYSLRNHSAEENAAAEFICHGGADAVIVVCDASCLERNLNLVFQCMETSEKVLVCVNLMDEAERNGISVDLPKLRELLGVPVVGTSARDKKGLDELKTELLRLVEGDPVKGRGVDFSENILSAVREFSTLLSGDVENLPPSAAAMRILCGDEDTIEKIRNALDNDAKTRYDSLISRYIPDAEKFRCEIISTEMKRAAEISTMAVSNVENFPFKRDRKLDRIFLSRKTAVPTMLILLGLILWMTIIGANYPSEMLGKLLFGIGEHLSAALLKTSAPQWVEGILVQGIYKVLAWVVSVMLPPMAIFFPMFTLLEDVGLLPRIAFNLDPCFRCANACGKQGITMAIGFGCNACGVTGCRIIDSPRERLIAILTNSFVPCNGRFPTIIAIITMFFVTAKGWAGSVISALVLLAAIMSGVAVTLMISKILSLTVLKGEPSSFILELPPYRRPQIGKILLRSILDRTVFVLARACTAAAPCGLLIWLMANIHIGNGTILSSAADFLEPAGKFLGLDGVIILGFILGFPANEIVMPIIIMTYLAQGSLTELSDTAQLHALLTEHGWKVSTAVCMLIFTLFHFPCATTCMTIRKETGSLKWTVLSIFLPTATGVLLCCAVSALCRFIHYCIN